MAPNAKLSKAYRAMKSLGYTSKIVKPILKTLLVLYDQNWSLIEDDQYAVLVDAILESEERKVKESQKFHLADEPEEYEPPLKRSRLSSQMVQTSSSLGVSSPSSNEDKDKPLHDMKNIMSESNRKEKMIGSAQRCIVDSETQAEILSPFQDCQREQKSNSPHSSSGLEHSKQIQLFSHEENNESNPLSPQTQLDDNCNTYTSSSVVPRMINKKSTHTSIICPENEMVVLPDNEPELECPISIVPPDHTTLLIEGTCSNAKENCSTSLEVIDLDAEDTYLLNAQSCDEGSSCAKEPLLQGYCLDSENSVATKVKDSSSNASHLDIASSCKGEVKLSITYESSLPSNFRMPSFDAVLRLMEEKYLKSYGISHPDFSVVKLMNDICDSFLAASTISTANERVSCADVHSSPVTPRELDARDVSNGNVNNVVGFCMSPNGPVGPKQFQICIEIPQIPRFNSLNCLKLSHCKLELQLPMKEPYSYRNKNLEELGNLNSSTSHSIVVFQEQHFPPNIMSSAYFVDDVTRGEEEFPISLINELSNEHQPLFKYIPRNIAYRNAYVKFLLARISDDNCCSNCFGDCLIPELPCACAGETGGEFAYMSGGLLKEKFLEDCILMNCSPQQKNFFYCQECPLERSKDKSLSGKCKGHLVRKFIKECWYKCGCTRNCGNRVVQRGITRRLQVFMTPEGKGWGLRTLEDLPKGAFICEYVGEIVTNLELLDRNAQNTGKKHTYPVLLDADWCTEGVLKDEEALCLDATFYGNVARFINHRCHDANLVEIPVEVETPDHHYYHLAFFTTRAVYALEELTWDYGIDFSDHTHPVEAFPCRCDSKFCRDTKAVNSCRSCG